MTATQLREAILARYGSLSVRLRQFAQYVLETPSDVALEKLAVISERCRVHPSTIVRFAKEFGFDGAGSMQRVFRAQLIAESTAAVPPEQARHAAHRSDDSVNLLRDFEEGTRHAVRQLARTVGAAELAVAFRLLERAKTVYVMGARSAFPVAAYLAYSLNFSSRRSVFIDGLAGLWREQAASIGAGDLLVNISYEPYVGEALEVMDAAHAQGTAVLVITDKVMSPIDKDAGIVLHVQEAEVHGLRSLSASMFLAETLVIGHAASGTRGSKGRRGRRGRAVREPA